MSLEIPSVLEPPDNYRWLEKISHGGCGCNQLLSDEISLLANGGSVSKCLARRNREIDRLVYPLHRCSSVVKLRGLVRLVFVFVVFVENHTIWAYWIDVCGLHSIGWCFLLLDSMIVTSLVQSQVRRWSWFFASLDVTTTIIWKPLKMEEE